MRANRLTAGFAMLFCVAIAIGGCARTTMSPTFLPASPTPKPPILPGPASCISTSPSPLPSPVASVLADAVAITKGVPGGAIGFYDNGAAYTYYWGYADQKNGTCMDASSIMELGSVTKTFTATLLAMAYNSGLVTPIKIPRR